MVRHVVDAVAAAGLPMPLVAVPAGADGLVEALGGLTVPVAVVDHAGGMGRSLAAAVRAIPGDWRGAIVCLGDMPFIGPALLRQLASRVDEDSIVTPMFGGRRGNPVAWGRAFFRELAALEDDRGGRDVLSRHAAAVHAFECGDAGILIDVDTPAALAEARARFG